MADEDSAPTITDSETTIEDNSVTVIVETPPEPEPEPAEDSPTLETVLAMITALAADMAGVRGEMAAINARLDNAESAQAESISDSDFSETIESAPATEPEPDTSPTSSHFWFRSIG